MPAELIPPRAGALMGRWVWVLLPVGIVGYVLSFTGASELLLFSLTTIGYCR